MRAALGGVAVACLAGVVQAGCHDPYVALPRCPADIPPRCYNMDTCQCGHYARKNEAECGGDVCAGVTCQGDTSCRPNYCGGCNHLCVANPTPQPTTASPPGLTPAPTPQPQPCGPYTPPTLRCPADVPPLCYSAAHCRCGSFQRFSLSQCGFDPCASSPCGSGYYCEANYCGGCRHVCRPGTAPATPQPPTPRPLTPTPPQTPTPPSPTPTPPTPPTPAPTAPKTAPAGCDPFDPPRTCGAGRCYDARLCACVDEPYFIVCKKRPCSHGAGEQLCGGGFRCVDDYPDACHGCSYVCVAEPPTSAPVTQPGGCADGADPREAEDQCFSSSSGRKCYHVANCDCDEYSQSSLVNCLGSDDPCEPNPCDSTHFCYRSTCGGCHHACIPKPAGCTQVTDPREAEDQCFSSSSGRKCYHLENCDCEEYPRVSTAACTGASDPCLPSPCMSGHTCHRSTCGGCHHACIPCTMQIPAGQDCRALPGCCAAGSSCVSGICTALRGKKSLP